MKFPASLIAYREFYFILFLLPPLRQRNDLRNDYLITFTVLLCPLASFIVMR